MKLFEFIAKASASGVVGWYVAYALLWLYEQNRLAGMTTTEQRVLHSRISRAAFFFGVVAGLVAGVVFVPR